MKISNIWRLLRILLIFTRKKNVKAKDIAQEIEISVRQVYRDIDCLKLAGIPVYSDRCGFTLMKDFYMPKISLEAPEIMTLFLLCSSIKAQKGTPYCELLTSACDKILNALPDNLKKIIMGSDSGVTVDFGLEPKVDYRQIDDIFSQIYHASMAKRQVRLKYCSMEVQKGVLRERILMEGAGQKTSGQKTVGQNQIGIKQIGITNPLARTVTDRIVDPYAFKLSFGIWYLVGYCHLRKEIRTFRIDRIQYTEVLDESFTIPEDFNMDGFFAGSWGIVRGKKYRVKLRFAREIADFVAECSWHPSQKLNRNKDGTLSAEFEVRGLSEIKIWILGFGQNVEVLEPEELRQDMQRTTLGMQKLY